jgi:hypothetical protein
LLAAVRLRITFIRNRKLAHKANLPAVNPVAVHLAHNIRLEPGFTHPVQPTSHNLKAPHQ